MLRFFIILNFLILKASAESDLYRQNEELSEVLAQNPYEPNYFTLLLGLFIVICLIYITGFVYQKLIKVKMNNTEIANKISVISTTSLGQGKNLHVIKLNGKYSLIGATNNNICHIKDFDEQEIDDFLKEENEENY